MAAGKTVAPGGEDAFYGDDRLGQVTRRGRGDLDTNQTAIVGVPAELEAFHYERAGNRDRYKSKKDDVPALLH